MKKTVSLIIAIAIVLCAAALPADAGQIGTFYTAHTVNQNGDILLAVSARQNPGIAALRMRLSYANAELTGVIDGGALEGFGASQQLSANPFTVQWVNSASIDLTDGSYIVLFRFRPSDGKTADDFEYSFSCGQNDILNSRLENVEFSWERGRLLRYDANNDSRTDTADALYILKTSVGIIKENGIITEICDSNDDGRIATDDALYILKLAVGIVRE
ncbi:MAG: hypothetical protein IKS19_02535 [Clostridia bacterium]|nr:hypothetical protein [Clostridia bacterium]